MSYSDMEFGRKDINLEAKVFTLKVKFSGQTLHEPEMAAILDSNMATICYQHNAMLNLCG